MLSRRLLAFCAFAVPLFAESIPASPSLVGFEEGRLTVRKRNPDNTLAPPAAYLIRGVVWTPGSNHSISGSDASALRAAASRDLPRIRGLNANTVHITIDAGADSAGLAVLDEVYRQGLMAAITVDGGTNDLSAAAAVVNTFRYHPAVLLWVVGERWNRNLYRGAASSVEDAARRTEAAAHTIKALDPEHPVATSYGYIDMDEEGLRLADTQNYVNNVGPSVDIWAVDAAGGTFGSVSKRWRSITTKPLMAASFGPSRGRDRQSSAAASASALSEWGDLLRNSSAGSSCGAVAGGFAASWNDDSAGISADQTNQALGDGAATASGGSPDAVYEALKSAFSESFVPPADATFTVSSIGSAGLRQPNTAGARFYRSGTLLRPIRGGGAQGFTAAIYDPESGSLEGPLSFDTLQTRSTGTAANELASLVADARAGSMIMLAVSGDAGLNEPGTCSLSGYAWNHNLISALQSIGSMKIASICAGGSWSMIAVKGSGVIEENIAVAGESIARAAVRLPAVRPSCSQPGKPVRAAGADSGPVQRGTGDVGAGRLATVRAAGPAAASGSTVAPSSGTGTGVQTFVASFPEALQGRTFEFEMATAPGVQPLCQVQYRRVPNEFWLFDSTVGALVGPVAPGGAGGLNSPECFLDTQNSTAGVVGANFQISLRLTLKAPLSGAKTIFLRTISLSGADTGYEAVGTWTVGTPGGGGGMDFNGDGKTDVLWQDPVSGLAQVWLLGGAQGTTLLGFATLTAGNPWRIAGTGDFNSDGHPDVVWQDPVSGTTQVWYLTGAQGNVLSGFATLSGPNAWRIVSVADFNGDSHPDLMWQDPATGQAQIWLMGGTQGTTLLGFANLSATNPWRIAGTADFNSDGHPDVVWQDPVSGSTQIWYLTGAQGNVFSSFATLSGANPWRIAAVGDYSGDSHPDVVWQDPATGTSQVWFLAGAQGTTITGSAGLSGPNPWRIVAPR